MLEIYVSIIFGVATVLLTYKDLKENSLFYILLNIFGILSGIVFEYPFITLGIWRHTLTPKFLGVSLYATFMYFPWITLTYSLSKKVSKYFNKVYAWYFLIGAFIAFFIDFISINLGFYQHNFDSVLRIFGVPIEMVIIEGVAISVFLVISERFIWFLFKILK